LNSDCPHLKDFNLRDRPAILEKINLKNADTGDDDLGALAAHCPELTSLDISFCCSDGDIDSFGAWREPLSSPCDAGMAALASVGPG
jgi:hypothetical protein